MDNLEKAIEWLDNLPADQRDAIERLLKSDLAGADLVEQEGQENSY